MPFVVNRGGSVPLIKEHIYDATKFAPTVLDEDLPVWKEVKAGHIGETSGWTEAEYIPDEQRRLEEGRARSPIFMMNYTRGQFRGSELKIDPIPTIIPSSDGWSRNGDFRLYIDCGISAYERIPEDILAGTRTDVTPDISLFAVNHIISEQEKADLLAWPGIDAEDYVKFHWFVKMTVPAGAQIYFVEDWGIATNVIKWNKQ